MPSFSDFLTYATSFNVFLLVFSTAFLWRHRLRRPGSWGFLLAGGTVFLVFPAAFRILTGISFYSTDGLRIGWYSFSYLILHGVLLLILYLTFDASLKELVLILGCSHLLQNMIHNFGLVLGQLFPAVPDPAIRIATILVSLAVAWAICLMSAKKLLRFDLDKVEMSVTWVISVCLIIVLTVLAQWTSVAMRELETSKLALYLYIGICSVLLLAVLLGVFNRSWLLHENEVINQLLKKAERQYYVSQANVDYINSRVHDLKHEIEALRKMSSSEAARPGIQKQISELGKIVEVYDDTVLTGNNVLDTLLTEEKSVCQQNRIQLEYVIDGGWLGFMEPVDLYVLFGNALDNAIESVQKVENEDRRVISVSVEKRNTMVAISMENFYEGQVILQDGLPRTSKQEKDMHGYGIKSIRYIAQKYGGFTSISTENQIFRLTILLPAAKAERTENNAPAAAAAVSGAG